MVNILCISDNIYTFPTEGIGNSWGVSGVLKTKNLKKYTNFN